jgi:hypothetical protein
MSEESSNFKSLWDYCTSENRLVPMPSEWNDLFNMLRKSSGGMLPPRPLILAAWHHTIPIEKALRFREHIKWAEEQQQLDEIEAFIHALPEDRWCHYGEV